MKKSALLLGLLLGIGLFATSPQAANAAVDQVCTVSETATFSPAVTNNPQTVTVTVNGQLFLCTSGSAPAGSYHETIVIPGLTCTNLIIPRSGTRIFDWTNTAIAPSTFSFNAVTTRVNGTVQVEFLGSITAGTFTPDPAIEEITGPEPNPLACATTGVAALAFAGTLTIGV